MKTTIRHTLVERTGWSIHFATYLAHSYCIFIATLFASLRSRRSQNVPECQFELSAVYTELGHQLHARCWIGTETDILLGLPIETVLVLHPLCGAASLAAQALAQYLLDILANLHGNVFPSVTPIDGPYGDLMGDGGFLREMSITSLPSYG